MLALVASQGRGRRWWPAMITLVWVVIVGPPPLPDTIDLIVSGVSQAAMVGVCIWAVLHATADLKARPTNDSAPTNERITSVNRELPALASSTSTTHSRRHSGVEDRADARA
jgi:hypothetical protein